MPENQKLPIMRAGAGVVFAVFIFLGVNTAFSQQENNGGEADNNRERMQEELHSDILCATGNANACGANFTPESMRDLYTLDNVEEAQDALKQLEAGQSPEEGAISFTEDEVVNNTQSDDSMSFDEAEGTTVDSEGATAENTTPANESSLTFEQYEKQDNVQTVLDKLADDPDDDREFTLQLKACAAGIVASCGDNVTPSDARVLLGQNDEAQSKKAYEDALLESEQAGQNESMSFDENEGTTVEGEEGEQGISFDENEGTTVEAEETEKGVSFEENEGTTIESEQSENDLGFGESEGTVIEPEVNGKEPSEYLACAAGYTDNCGGNTQNDAIVLLGYNDESDAREAYDKLHGNPFKPLNLTGYSPVPCGGGRLVENPQFLAGWPAPHCTDSAANTGGLCGLPAANLFCQANGSPKALCYGLFHTKRAVSLLRICENCLGLKYVVCK